VVELPEGFQQGNIKAEAMKAVEDIYTMADGKPFRDQE